MDEEQLNGSRCPSCLTAAIRFHDHLASSSSRPSRSVFRPLSRRSVSSDGPGKDHYRELADFGRRFLRQPSRWAWCRGLVSYQFDTDWSRYSAASATWSARSSATERRDGPFPGGDISRHPVLLFRLGYGCGLAAHRSRPSRSRSALCSPPSGSCRRTARCKRLPDTRWRQRCLSAQLVAIVFIRAFPYRLGTWSPRPTSRPRSWYWRWAARSSRRHTSSTAVR